jgi:membrane-bound lytic murein transglycosylase A
VLPAPAATLEPVGFHSLPGWEDDDHAAALQSFKRSCSEILKEGSAFGRSVIFGGKREQWIETCQRADLDSPREFFETNFLAFRVIDATRPKGLFTGYYEPEAAGSRTSDSSHMVPIYRRPADLVAFKKDQQEQADLNYGRFVNGEPRPYYSRKEIEQGALKDRGLEIVWLKDWADVFFMHIQGSGRVRLADGSVVRLAYAAKSGLAYASIGRILVERGIFSPEELSMQALREWMAGHPEGARELMWRNESFIFFREVELEDPSLGALGAQHVQLTPLRSIAVDRNFWMFGMPVWLDAKVPAGKQAGLKVFRKLLIAQDTGTAIKGLARGDVYWGSGEDAALIAGHMKSPGTMTVLLPKVVALGLGLIK